MARAKFSRFIQPKRCVMCGKLTTYSQNQGSDCAQCERCYNAAGIENEHLDYGHSVPDPDCPLCHPEKYPEWVKKYPEQYKMPQPA
jgi:hypothetical protein